MGLAGNTAPGGNLLLLDSAGTEVSPCAVPLEADETNRTGTAERESNKGDVIEFKFPISLTVLVMPKRLSMHHWPDAAFFFCPSVLSSPSSFCNILSWELQNQNEVGCMWLCLCLAKRPIFLCDFEGQLPLEDGRKEIDLSCNP